MSWPSIRSQKNMCLVNSKIHHKRNLTVTSSKYMNRMIYHQQVTIYCELAKSQFSCQLGLLESVINVSVAPVMSKR